MLKSNKSDKEMAELIGVRPNEYSTYKKVKKLLEEKNIEVKSSADPIAKYLPR